MGSSRCRFRGHSAEDVRVVARSFRLDDALLMVVVFNALRESLLLCNTSGALCQARHPRPQ